MGFKMYSHAVNKPKHIILQFSSGNKGVKLTGSQTKNFGKDSKVCKYVFCRDNVFVHSIFKMQ